MGYAALAHSVSATALGTLTSRALSRQIPGLGLGDVSEKPRRSKIGTTTDPEIGADALPALTA
jgi:hypothetical protein